MLLLSSCIGTKHLKEDESLLYKQHIKAPKGINTDDLNDLYAQSANRKILGTPLAPLVWIHYQGKKRFDPKKYENKIRKTEKKFDAKIAKAKTDKKVNNLQFRKQSKLAKFNDRIINGNQFMQWGEPVAVFDSTKVSLTVLRFKEYLFSHGYFQNKVDFKTTNIARLVNVRYTIEPGKPYILDTVYFKVKDSAIYYLLMANVEFSLLKIGDQYNQDKIVKERERIDLLLKASGRIIILNKPLRFCS